MNNSYYAVIPATVRYDKDLPFGAKLLYGEITALSNQRGYCFAQNAYFAKLYGLSTSTISRWISKMVQKGYLKLEIIFIKDTKAVDERRLYICDIPYGKNEDTPAQKCKEGIRKNEHTPIRKNAQDNNTRLNTTVNKERARASEKPSLEEIAGYCKERRNGINPQQFFDFYESKGWMVGKTKMKDWRACVRTWENRQKAEDKQPRRDYITRDYTPEDFQNDLDEIVFDDSDEELKTE